MTRPPHGPSRTLKAALLGLALTAASYTAASATVTFTWDPAATGDTTAGAFSADRFGINDWTSIVLGTDPSLPGSVTQTGFLEISGFTLAGSSVSTVHTTGAGGYGIYEQFTATSHLVCTGTSCVGAFDTITADTYLYSTLHGLAFYTFPGTVPTIHLPSHANAILLATESGPISGTPNLAEISDGIPTANVGVSFNPEAAEAGFFISPTSSFVLDLEQAFTNTPGVISTIPGNCGRKGTLPCTYEIKGGGGNADFFKVPEPATLALLGLGLTALGFVRRRHRAG